MIIQSKSYPLQVIRKWSGSATGEEIYKTNDGTIWKGDICRYFLPEKGTGDRQGILICDKVFEF
jgi:hypothetical protein